MSDSDKKEVEVVEVVEQVEEVTPTEEENVEKPDAGEQDAEVDKPKKAKKAKKAKKVKKAKTREPLARSVPAVESVVRGIVQNPEHVALVDSVYNKVVLRVAEVIKGEGVTVANIVIIVDTTMRTVGKLQTLSGMEKKALTITVVHKILEVSDLKEADRAALKIVVDAMLDPLIDQIFAIAPKLYGKVKARCQALSCCRAQ